MVVVRQHLWHSAAVSLQNVAASVLRRLPHGARTAILHRTGRFAPWEDGFDFTPPKLQPGEHTGPPDFVGIGVQKAGTTWWFRLISSHPGVASRLDLHKERHVLSRFGVQTFTSADVEDYQSWFPRPAGTITGEWTPDYVYYPWLPALVARAAPRARLLVMVRDPVERFRSGLAHQLRHGSPRTGATVAEAVHRGLYEGLLRPWWERFDADQLLVLQYEACVLEPDLQLARTYRFLGVDDAFRPVDLDRPDAATGGDKVDLTDDVRSRLAAIYAPDVAQLARRLPHLDLTIWPNFARLQVP
jgi:hypothetical protein